MDLDTLITEADPACHVPLAGPDSAEGIRLYRRITAQQGHSRREARGHAKGLAVAGVAVSSLAIAAAVTIAVVPGSPAQPARQCQAGFPPCWPPPRSLPPAERPPGTCRCPGNICT